jgi:hypothetical protein
MPLPPLFGLQPEDPANDPPVLVWEALKNVLKADSYLNTATITWRTWEGDPDDAAPPEDSQLPWVRLTPYYSAQMTYSDEAFWTLYLRVMIETKVAGTRWNDSANFWGAIRRALNRDRPFAADSGPTTVFGYFRQAGATTYRFESAASIPRDVQPPVAASPLQPENLTAVGVVVFTLDNIDALS